MQHKVCFYWKIYYLCNCNSWLQNRRFYSLGWYVGCI